MFSLSLIFLMAGTVMGNWTTSENRLMLDGEPVILHGLGTTCTEYLLRGVGMKCWASYNWNDKSHIITETNDEQLTALLNILTEIKASSGVIPAVRIPMTASYWLNVKTSKARGNMGKYPNLSAQYRTLITKMVSRFTAAGAVVILDLHWNDDDTEQQPMALKTRADGRATGNALLFWDSIASTFGSNKLVFYELYNEPHIDTSVWMNGNKQYAGMLEMIDTVRKHTPDSVLVIAGAKDYAYDSDSLVTLNEQLEKMNESHVMWNFHPYMGPAQSGDAQKCPSGFKALLQSVSDKTHFPAIVTEFGQACCPTNGACEACAATGSMGYEEAILSIAKAAGASWLPWGWRPSAVTPGQSCEDINGGNANGTALIHPTDGKGADWASLWAKYKI